MESKRFVKGIIPGIVFCICLLAFPPLISGQDWAKPLIGSLHRIDMRDLGYPNANEIPENSSAVTSLLTAAGGNIYGGTSGDEAYLFVFEPAKNKVQHLGRLKGESGIHHALVQDRNGFIYIGTGKNMFEDIRMREKGAGGEEIDDLLWKDIKGNFQNYPGGHLYRYDPSQSDRRVKLVDMDCEVIDLGIPVPGNSIYALKINPAREEIYGLTYPDGHFFTYELKKNAFSDLGSVDERIVFHGPERHWRTLPRDLICDKSGRVYTSGTDGKIICYDPEKQTMTDTGMELPGDYYYAEFYADYAVVECFAMDETGKIYGGTSDGYLFSFCPESWELVNYGKAQSARRFRGITAGMDGKIYFVSGERGGSKHCTLFSFDPATGGFESLGMPIVDRSPYYYWRGYQFDAMTAGLDGTIYMGESERRSHLFLFIP